MVKALDKAMLTLSSAL